MKKFIWGTVLLVMFFCGCAVQRHGRLMPVIPSEADNLSCEEIVIEIDKCTAFIKNVNDKNSQFTGGDVLAFLGDFGIGDAWEVSEAITSATDRISQLEKLKSKKCGSIAREEKQKSVATAWKPKKVKVVSKRKPSKLIKQCSTCGSYIGRFEKFELVGDKIACAACYSKLTESPKIAPVARQSRRSQDNAIENELDNLLDSLNRVRTE